MRQAREAKQEAVTRHGRHMHWRNWQNRDAVPMRRLRQRDVVVLRAGPSQKMDALVWGVHLKMIGQTRAQQ